METKSNLRAEPVACHAYGYQHTYTGFVVVDYWSISNVRAAAHVANGKVDTLSTTFSVTFSNTRSTFVYHCKTRNLIKTSNVCQGK